MRRAQPGRPASAGVSALCVLVLFTGSLLLLPARPAIAAPPAPKKKDSRPAFKSKNAELTTSVEPAEAKPGETVTFKVIAKLDPGYHIYRAGEKPAGGPSYTTFDLFDAGGLKAEGDWTASREPTKHHEPAFDNIPFLEYYEDEVTWSIKLKVPDDATPGKKTIRVQTGYMVCNDNHCSMPGQWTLPVAEVTVKKADGAATTSGSTTKKETSATTPAPAKQAVPPASKEAVATIATPPPPPAEKPATSPPAPHAATSPATESAATEPATNEIASLAQQGLIPFLLASALGGLFALVMPCVWPMVPITVNFFVKQGQGEGGRKRATALAITYCLSIIGVFTAVGVFCSFFFSATSLPRLANNPWLNLAVALLFTLFGLSLLGLFEIRLPSFLLNASSQGEGRGGLVGVVFMALTLTITSFTCTFPVVGGLLVMAAGGNFFYPIVGLATFAAVLAFPFFLLALSPNLISKMPRSGDWMNAVKVVGGLIEIGAALKFLNTAELATVLPRDAWCNAYVILTSWVVLSLVCGFYLLGMFRTDHDHDDVKVGPGRLVSGALFLGLGLYLAPALFGHPPQGRIWDRLIVGILPPDVNDLRPPVAIAGAGAGSMEVKSTSNDPAQAAREQKSFHGVQWGMSFDQAREVAAKEKRPILIDFTGTNCSACRTMESGVFPRPEVVDLLRKFVTVQLYTDFAQIDSITPDQRKELGEENAALLIDKLKLPATNPIYVILSPSGKLIGVREGLVEAANFVAFLKTGIEKASQEVGTKVAQAGPDRESGEATTSEGR